MSTGQPGGSIGAWMLAMGVGLLVACLVLPGVFSRPVARGPSCKMHLKQLGIALFNYTDSYGSLPPAYVADENGKPLYSWRVIILPFIQEQALYESFDLSQPWDSPRNRELSKVTLPAFRCPIAGGETPSGNLTDYVAVIGPNTPWHGTDPVSRQDLGKDLSKLILLVEVADSKIPWAKPDDLTLSTVLRGINKSKTSGISSHHEGGAQVLLADGHVLFLRNTLSPGELQSMLTIPDDAEPD